MIFDEQESIIVITGTSVSAATLVNNVVDAYNTIADKNLIINLASQDKITANELLLFLEISNRHRKKKKSFVMVTNKVNYNKIPDALIVVPTLREAYDIIAMEEIERDLGF